MPTPTGRTRPRPRHRAPAGLRALFGLTALGGGLFAVALMLSDRAPGLLDRLFDARARRLWARIDADERTDVLTSAGPPEPDTVVHIAVWFGLTLLVALTLWTWRGLLLAGIGAAGFGVAVEWAQRRWSSGRSAEWSDVGADLVGTALGVVAALAIMGTWSALGAAVERRRSARAG